MKMLLEFVLKKEGSNSELSIKVERQMERVHLLLQLGFQMKVLEGESLRR